MVMEVARAGPVGCGTSGMRCGTSGTRCGTRCSARGDEAGPRLTTAMLDLPGEHVCGRAEADIETGSFVYRACVVP
jgi:hypothetical protein